MLKQRKGELMWPWLALLAVGIVLTLVSCRTPAPVVIAQRDSTHTERVVTYRDTVVTVPGDTAALRLGAEELGRLLVDLRGQVRILRGQHRAALELRNVRDTLVITALCDELQVKLDSALVHERELTRRLQTVTAVTQPEQERMLPAWARGVVGVASAIGLLALFILVLPTIKQLFSHGKA